MVFIEALSSSLADDHCGLLKMSRAWYTDLHQVATQDYSIGLFAYVCFRVCLAHLGIDEHTL